MAQQFPLGRWGEEHHGLDPRTLGFVREHLGDPIPAPPPQPRELRPSRLSAERCAALFPGVEFGIDDEVRARHARGMSYLDLLTWRARSGAIAAPDAVLVPRDHAQALAVVQTCSREQIAVVPFGGGTSVTGAINTPEAGEYAAVVAVASAGLDRVIEVDTISGIAHVGAGMTGPGLEDHLAPIGWTFGHFPQSWQRASIGGFIAARSSGQASAGYGRIEDMLVSARLATPVGTWDVGGFPAASVGPDLRHLVLGSEGTLGVITSARLRVRRRPRVRDFAAALVPGSFAQVADRIRELTRSPWRPAVLRASDAPESEALLAMSGPQGAVGSTFGRYLRLRGAMPGSLVILGWEGERSESVAGARAVAKDLLDGAVWLGAGPGRSWARGRFHGPFLRDSLLDAGYLVETFETVTTWSNIDRLRDAVREVVLAELGERCYVMAHISHVYDTGASLYFTVLAGGTGDADLSAQRWLQAKASIMDSLLDAGGAISHHHGVGRDHAPWLTRQVGPVGVDVLRSVRSALDPRGVLNPGVLSAGAATPGALDPVQEAGAV